MLPGEVPLTPASSYLGALSLCKPSLHKKRYNYFNPNTWTNKVVYMMFFLLKKTDKELSWELQNNIKRGWERLIILFKVVIMQDKWFFFLGEGIE